MLSLASYPLLSTSCLPLTDSLYAPPVAASRAALTPTCAAPRCRPCRTCASPCMSLFYIAAMTHLRSALHTMRTLLPPLSLCCSSRAHAAVTSVTLRLPLAAVARHRWSTRHRTSCTSAEPALPDERSRFRHRAQSRHHRVAQEELAGPFDRKTPSFGNAPETSLDLPHVPSSSQLDEAGAGTPLVQGRVGKSVRPGVRRHRRRPQAAAMLKAFQTTIPPVHGDISARPTLYSQ